MFNIDQEKLNLYYNAVDCLIPTSKYEGSPNVIKEAMACNCPIVSTDVGDVKWVIGETEGCYICSFEPEDVAEKIQKALNFGKRTNGRQRIMDLGLDSGSVAEKLHSLYREILHQ